MAMSSPHGYSVQYDNDNGARVKEVRGTIVMPVLSDLTINVTQDRDLNVKSFENIIGGKLYSGYVKLNVKCNRPWIVSVVANNSTFYTSTSSGIQTVPVNVIKLKRTGTDKFINLSSLPQVILQNENNLIQNNYSLDLKVQPEFGYSGGRYNFDMTFTLTPQ